MSQSLAIENIYLISLLVKLREFNTDIGTYESCSVLNNFNYLVKLNNGEIIINSALMAIYIQTPNSISNSTYRNAAQKFFAKVDEETNLRYSKNNSRVLLFVFVLLLLIIIISTYLPNY